MSLPGFTAEASLDRTRLKLEDRIQHHRVHARPDVREDAREVRPQIAPLLCYLNCRVWGHDSESCWRGCYRWY
jgi:hypothetical protein